MSNEEMEAKLNKVMEMLATMSAEKAALEERVKAAELVKAAPPTKDRPKAWVPVSGEVKAYIKTDKVEYGAVVRCERRFTDQWGGRVPFGQSGYVDDHEFATHHVRDIVTQGDEFLQFAAQAEADFNDPAKRAAAYEKAKAEKEAARQKKAKKAAAKLI